MTALPNYNDYQPDHTQPISIGDRKQQTADRIGESQAGIREYRMNLWKLRQAGVLLDITCLNFTIFVAQAGWLELGIPTDDIRAAQFTRGKKHLIPRKYTRKLESFDTRFRTLFRKFSLEISGFAPYRYLTYDAYEAWREQMDELEDELEDLKTEILEQYPRFFSTLRDTFADIAEKSWDSYITSIGGNPDAAALRINDDETFGSREEFTDYIVQAVLKRLPLPERIKEIGVKVRIHMLTAESDVAEDRAATEYWRAFEAEQRAKTAYFDEQTAAQIRLAREEEMAQQRIIEEHERTQRRLASAEADERELEIKERNARHEAIKEEIRTRVAEQIEDVVLPVEEIIRNERERLQQGLDEVLEKMKAGGLHGRTAEKIGNLLEHYRYFQEFDPDLLDAVGELEQALERRLPHSDPARRKAGDTERDVADIAVKVRALILETQNAAVEVAASIGATRAGALMLG